MPVAPVKLEADGERRQWLSILAKARPDEVAAAWDALPQRPAYSALRAPETGLVLVRGDVGVAAVGRFAAFVRKRSGRRRGRGGRGGGRRAAAAFARLLVVP